MKEKVKESEGNREITELLTAQTMRDRERDRKRKREREKEQQKERASRQIAVCV